MVSRNYFVNDSDSDSDSMILILTILPDQRGGGRGGAPLRPPARYFLNDSDFDSDSDSDCQTNEEGDGEELFFFLKIIGFDWDGYLLVE